MSETTQLDHAHAAMDAAPDDDSARLAFYRTLAESELFLLLREEPHGDVVEPQSFELEDATYVLAFDREERLARFTGQVSPFAALSGRSIAELLSAQSLGLGLNLETGPSAMMIPPAAISWLHDTLQERPEAIEGKPVDVTAPKGLPDALITAIDGKLAQAAGLAHCAYLVGVTYAGGRKSHLLAVVDAAPMAEEALTQSFREALVFSGIEAGILDIGFFKGTDSVIAGFASVGLRFDLPELAIPTPPKPPGMDPGVPPKLR